MSKKRQTQYRSLPAKQNFTMRSKTGLRTFHWRGGGTPSTLSRPGWAGSATRGTKYKPSMPRFKCLENGE